MPRHPFFCECANAIHATNDATAPVSVHDAFDKKRPSEDSNRIEPLKDHFPVLTTHWDLVVLDKEHVAGKT